MKIVQSSLVYVKTIFLFSSLGLFSQTQPSVERVTFLGVSASTLSEGMSEQLNLPSGIHLSVAQVAPDSPAEQAGLKLYDILLQLDDQILVNSDQLKALVRMKNPNDRVQLKILRKGKPITLSANLSQIDQTSIPTNSQIYEMKNKDFFSVKPFSSNIDQLMPKFDPSIWDLFKKHRYKKLKNINSHKNGLDLDNPIHGSNSHDTKSQSFEFSSELKKTSFSDENGIYEYSVEDGVKNFRVTSIDGEVLFDGSVTHQSDRDKLPLDLKKKLLELENF